MAEDLKAGIQSARGGKTLNFGFIKGNPLDGFMVTPKKIASAVLVELQKLAGKPAKPILGKVYFDKNLSQLIFRVAGPAPGTLKSGLKEASMQLGVSLGSYDVVSGKEGEEDFDPAAASQATDPLAAFKARLGALTPLLTQVMTLKTTNVAKVQTLNAGVKEAVAAKDYTKGLTLLNELEPVLNAELAAQTPIGRSANAPPAPSGGPKPAVLKGAAQPKPAAATGTKVLFTQARLAWDSARKKAHEEIEKLKGAIRVVYKGKDDFPKVESSLAKLDEVLQHLDERLIDKLDQALNAGPEERAAFSAEALVLVREYKAYLTSDPLVQSLDANPFAPLTVHKTLLNTVTVLEKRLA